MTSNNVIGSIRIYQDVAMMNKPFCVILVALSKAVLTSWKEGGSEACQLFLRYVTVTAIAQRLTCGVISGVLCDFSFRCLWMG